MIKTVIKALIFITCSASNTNLLHAQETSRWQLTDDEGIEWKVSALDSHMDHLEMSGFCISAIVHYGIEEGKLKQQVHLVFPMLRTIPNDTHASLGVDIPYEQFAQIKVNGEPLDQRPDRFYIKGYLGIHTLCSAGIEITHQLFPSTDEALFIDKMEIHNPTDQTLEIELPDVAWTLATDEANGVYGSYSIKVVSSRHGLFVLRPGESLDFALIYSGQKTGTEAGYVSPDYEFNKRIKLIENTFNDLKFDSPDEIVNRAFAFAKLRAVESIFRTKGGLMHGPGGGSYYAAIWANDQAEYANPFFPFLGNPAGNESALNAFRHFARYVNAEFHPIPSSIIAEGVDFWHGAGDRGDMAMIAYGAARFALAYGDEKSARELWPLIEWCLEYCNRKLNDEGVVCSDSDELEGRFPAGEANLNTSSLYYDALISAAYLGKELHVEPGLIEDYLNQSTQLEKAIEAYFGKNMAGFETYRYYEGNDLLRAWICSPLTVGIFKRSKATADALFNSKLWTEDGLASVEGSTTFWDRATLYAFRGVFAAGETERAMPYFLHYTYRRLLGEHVPYPIEAFPEGNQRHLSAESALYCRVITEGIMGIRPIGLNAFLIAPKLPEAWDSMALRNIKAFNHSFDIEVQRKQNKLWIRVYLEDTLCIDALLKINETLQVNLP